MFDGVKKLMIGQIRTLIESLFEPEMRDGRQDHNDLIKAYTRLLSAESVDS